MFCDAYSLLALSSLKRGVWEGQVHEVLLRASVFFCTPRNQHICVIGFIQVLNQLVTQRMLYQLSTSLVPPSTNLVLLIEGTSEPSKMYLRLEARSIHSVFVMTFEAPKDSDSKLALS